MDRFCDVRTVQTSGNDTFDISGFDDPSVDLPVVSRTGRADTDRACRILRPGKASLILCTPSGEMSLISPERWKTSGV